MREEGEMRERGRNEAERERWENNPWLSERALLVDGAPLGLQGQEL